MLIGFSLILTCCRTEIKGKWISIYAQQEWYIQKQGSETNLVGTVYDQGETQWPRIKGQQYDRYFFETLSTSYHIWLRKEIKIDFSNFVGKKVEIICKKGIIERNQVKIKIIIPAKIRVLW